MDVVVVIVAAEVGVSGGVILLDVVVNKESFLVFDLKKNHKS